MSANTTSVISRAFIWRRVHSLLGLMIVLYLIEHLVVNSQAALWIGNDGNGFVKLVDFIHNLPYLQVIELVFIGVPILFHGILGVKYALTSKGNSRWGKGDKPTLQYGRNIAYSWQRITAWLLIIGIVGHVMQMRFLEKPKKTRLHNQNQYLVKLNFDEGLYTLSNRLHVELFDLQSIMSLKQRVKMGEKTRQESSPVAVSFNPTVAKESIEKQKLYEEELFVTALSSYSLRKTQVVASSEKVGTAFLLMVRNIFKNPFWAVLYSAFVVAAVYHAFNGVWTALITWGAILSYRSQKVASHFVIWIMIALALLGLFSVWGTYWVNLKT